MIGLFLPVSVIFFSFRVLTNKLNMKIQLEFFLFEIYNFSITHLFFVNNIFNNSGNSLYFLLYLDSNHSKSIYII